MIHGDKLPLKNISRNAQRSIALLALTAFLSFICLGGLLTVAGLRSGLASLEARLGADLMVVPYSASTKNDLDDMIMQGNPGYFYMKRSVLEELESIEGISQMSEQYYLASTASSCCSSKVQIIGINPETDFTIQPWISANYKSDLGYMEVLVGNSLNAFPGDTLTFFGSTVTVAAKLDATGTYLDTAVFAGNDTIITLMEAAYEKQIYRFDNEKPSSVISCVMINVADGYDIDSVMGDIKVHVKGVAVVKTKSMVSSVSDGLENIAGIIVVLLIVIWLIALAIMIISYSVVYNERKKEFAILRVLGASGRRLSGILMKEALYISGAGAAIGILLSILLVKLFGQMIESSLSMPFLFPSIGNLILLIIGAGFLSLLSAVIAAGISAGKVNRIDPAYVLRGEH